MSSVFESVFSPVELVAKPILLVKQVFQFGLRCICVVIQTWIELLRSAVYLHLDLLWKLLIFVIAVFSLPMRALTALQRERLLETQLYRMRGELDKIIWERKELEERLHVAHKERRMVEMMLKELEAEHDEAIADIELLEKEVHTLKEEMRRLKEVQGKSLLDHKVDGDAGYGYNIKNFDDFGTSSWKAGDNNSENQKVAHKGLLEADHDLMKAGPEAQGSGRPNNSGIIPRNYDFLARQREVARSRSLFTAILSVVVGMIVWEAKDPCMPLVVALFTVVFMSLMSVVRFYFTIEHKPASEAVALLSLNWFMLGTLTYPMLPRVALVLSPLALNIIERALKWLAL